jgi:hypothetical protein
VSIAYIAFLYFVLILPAVASVGLRDKVDDLTKITLKNVKVNGDNVSKSVFGTKTYYDNTTRDIKFNKLRVGSAVFYTLTLSSAFSDVCWIDQRQSLVDILFKLGGDYHGHLTCKHLHDKGKIDLSYSSRVIQRGNELELKGMMTKRGNFPLLGGGSNISQSRIDIDLIILIDGGQCYVQKFDAKSIMNARNSDGSGSDYDVYKIVSFDKKCTFD